MKIEKESINGQMNLFDSTLEPVKETQVEKEPKKEQKSEPIKINEKANRMYASMYRIFEKKETKEKLVVAYIDYNKVYWKEETNRPILMCYPNAKMAVDAYMDKVISYAKEGKQIQEKLILEDV